MIEVPCDPKTREALEAAAQLLGGTPTAVQTVNFVYALGKMDGTLTGLNTTKTEGRAP